MSLLNDQDYIIDVGPQGTFQRSGTYQTLPEHIDQLFNNFEQHNQRKIAIYFHGGLVNEQAGLTGARNMAPHIIQGQCAPVCFVWETGLVETISTNITKIHQTKLFTKLLKAIIKKVSEKITISDPQGRGTAQVGLTYAQIQEELSSPIPFKDFDRISAQAGGRGPGDVEDLVQNKIVFEAQLNAELRRVIETDPEFIEAIEQTELSVPTENAANGSRGIISLLGFVKHAVAIVYRIIKRFIEKRDHGIYPTIVEEILRELYIAELGAWVWNAMKIKAADMWKSNQDRQGLDQYVGRYFLEKLIAYKNKYPDTKISLIGHSAGSIAISHLLNNTAALSADFTYDHILLLAPACRIDLFQTALLTNPNRCKDIRIFTMSDDYESQDVLVPFVYTRSLLYMVSGILEDEGKSYDAYILGLQRHIGYQLPYNIPGLQTCHDYIYMAGLDRVSFSIATTTVDGMTTTATKHGDFDDNPATLTSIEWILKQ